MQPSVDAIVVLGCRVFSSGRPSDAARRRVAAAAAAYREGIAPRVIAAGGRRWGHHREAVVLRAELVRAGVPASAVVPELCSLTTYENAIYSAAILRGLGGRRALVVTCAWHLPRALADFRAAGLEAHPCAAAGPASGLVTRAGRLLHEAVSRRLDALAMRRGRVLWESAPSAGAALGAWSEGP